MRIKAQLPDFRRHFTGSGFTMLEVIAVLVILGIVSAVAISRVSGLGVSLYADADRLAADLRYAQSLAMTSAFRAIECESTVLIRIDADGWEFGYDSCESDDDVWRWRFADGGEKRDTSPGVSITGNDVAFKYPSGNVDSDADVTIELQKGNTDIDVKVHGITGYVEVLR